MPLGTILVDWDTQLGPVVKASYPQSFSLSKGEINKILMSHSISATMVPEIIEISVFNKIIISFCDKSKVSEIGYVMVLLVLHEDELEQVSDYKGIFIENMKRISKLRGLAKTKEFLKFGNDLFSKKNSRKLVLVGPAAVGKTSIKKFYFEGIEAGSLLQKAIEPTYGLVHQNYAWLDLELGIADLAGQELSTFLNNDIESKIAFQESDVIIYIFDYEYWKEFKFEIYDHIHSLRQIQEKLKLTSELKIFCHKCDLLPPNQTEEIKTNIKQDILGEFHIKIEFTSLTEDYLPQFMKLMQGILQDISPLTQKINAQISTLLSNYEDLSLILLDNNLNIVMQLAKLPSPHLKMTNVSKIVKYSRELFEAFCQNIGEIKLEGNQDLHIHLLPLENHEYFLVFLSQKYTKIEFSQITPIFCAEICKILNEDLELDPQNIKRDEDYCIQ